MNIALPPETREEQIERVYKLGFKRGKKQARKKCMKDYTEIKKTDEIIESAFKKAQKLKQL